MRGPHFQQPGLDRGQDRLRSQERPFCQAAGTLVRCRRRKLSQLVEASGIDYRIRRKHNESLNEVATVDKLTQKVKRLARQTVKTLVLSLVLAIPVALRAETVSTLFCIINARAARSHDERGWVGPSSKEPDPNAPFNISKKSPQFAGYIFSRLDTPNPRIRLILVPLEDRLPDLRNMVRKLGVPEGLAEELDPVTLAKQFKEEGLDKFLHKDEIKGTAIRQSGNTVFFIWEWASDDFLLAAVDLKQKKAAIVNVAKGIFHHVSAAALTADCE